MWTATNWHSVEVTLALYSMNVPRNYLALVVLMLLTTLTVHLLGSCTLKLHLKLLFLCPCLSVNKLIFFFAYLLIYIDKHSWSTLFPETCVLIGFSPTQGIQMLSSSYKKKVCVCRCHFFQISAYCVCVCVCLYSERFGRSLVVVFPLLCLVIYSLDDMLFGNKYRDCQL